MIMVDGVPVQTPSEMTWGLQRVSAKDAGRTEDAIMHVNQVALNRKLSLAWNGLSAQQAHAIAVAFVPQYIMITYWDLLEGSNVTKKFYTGDWSAPYKTWTMNKKIYSSLSFDVIEV